MEQWLIVGGVVAALFTGCATTKTEKPPEDKVVVDDNATPPGMVRMVEYEQKAAELLMATAKLEELSGDIDAMDRRLRTICADYPDHVVCDVHKQAEFAREAFCADENFTTHVDEIVSACQQGACKEVDEAQLLSRTQYMTLLEKLPHKLVTFGSAKTHLDKADQRELQQFLEAIRGTEGYIIIVGRASREGPWRDNLRYALDRAENTRQYLVTNLGIDDTRVGYITYGHEKMYLTPLDAERLATKKLSQREANRSALVFTYPCFKKP
ncbi:MAG: hypothetical protein EP329_18460 [Deltaproteobacteria bacterium]|nr:MAG: hypothetical protein EP329_18460 [Deltaproteobacteria bacterium]